MLPDTCLGDRYIVDERIGGGERGSVWFGRDTVLDRRVRIKVLDPDLARDDAVRDRFRQTALAVASLDVRGIADVHDCVEEPDGDDITVCQIGERVDGEPLHRLLAARTFSSEDALTLVAQAARSLHAAHQKGLRHLNLKSSNLIIGTDSSVRIVDFGFQGPGEVAEDVSALGAIAYECLTGVKFSEVEPDASSGEQDPQPLPADIAPAVAVFVKRALSKDPAERFETAARLAVECEQISNAHDVPGALLERDSPVPEADTLAVPEPVVGLGLRLEAALTPPAGPDVKVTAAAASESTTRLREPSEPTPDPAPKPRRKRLVLVAVLLLFIAFSGTAAVMALLPGDPRSSTEDGNGDGNGVAEPQDTSPITTGPPPSRGGDEAGNDPSESESPSDSESPSKSEDDDGPEEPVTVQVPDVVGDDPNNAYSELRDAGLEVNIIRSGKGDHACPVSQQSPGGGATVDKGSTVDMSVRMVKNPNKCNGNGG